MFDTIYIEESVLHNSRTIDLLKRFPNASKITCQRYSEIFNRKAQSFRLQKKKPALILAKKFNNFVLPTPAGYGIGAKHNFYFSHMLNCIYDCRYCFLQGMYRSAHYVIFVNYDDFESAIRNKMDSADGENIHFFSGYDCDSLAFEPVTRFVEYFLPLFSEYPNAFLELRTKSTQIRNLLNIKPLPNCVVAFSLTPGDIAEVLEHKTPSVDRRIKAMCRLQAQGWSIGLRFDPLIYQSNFEESYERLFKEVFTKLDLSLIHSVSLGSFRLPKSYFKTLSRMYPDERLFASPLIETNGMISYKQSLQDELTLYCTDAILQYVSRSKFFPCDSSNIVM
ncbi:MAG: spore photoproduct lyase [Gammaproteobacteria bacterium]|jgi:spore photoproduct lyase